MGRKVAVYVGGMWVVTWGFWLIGAHTPMSFAVALVGCTGLGLRFAALFDWMDPR